MPVRGQKPKPAHLKRNRMPVLEFTEVPNVPNELAPALPKWSRRYRPIWEKDAPQPRDWPEATRRWWGTISRMPHAALWQPSDWQFAYDTALVAAAFHCGQVRFAKELRDREKILGTTFDARRDLRIRYIEPGTGKESDPAETASVTAMADYQRMVDAEG